MARYGIYNLSDGVFCREEIDDSAPLVDSSKFQVKEIPAGKKAAALKVENDALVDDVPAQAAVEASILNRVRKERNAKLAACDWTQMPDSPLDQADKDAYATYRQDLRDLPADIDMSTISGVEDVVWPSEPS
jgi:hypothetical protein